MSVDFDYDENQGNSAHTECLLSMETDNNFYVATSGALPWREPDNVTLPAIEWSSLAFLSSHFSGRRRCQILHR